MASNALKRVLLGEPMLGDGLVIPRFFNGRLLSGELLTQSRDAERRLRERVGQAVGAGVVHGLWVGKAGPALKVTAGLGITLDGATLQIPHDVEVSFARPGPDDVVRRDGAFTDCNVDPSDSPNVVKGVYVLILGPATGTHGRAPVSSLAGADVCCNVRDDIAGVQFRIAPVIAGSNLNFTDKNRRSHVAHLCFGTRVGAVDDPGVDPFPLCLAKNYELSRAELPLAVFHWTGAALGFVDVWAARRFVTPPQAEDDGTRWCDLLGDRHAALREAMFLQFQRHLADDRPPTAATHFAWLPPAGVLTSADPKSLTTTWKTFLGTMAPADAQPVAGPQDLRAALRRGLLGEPIKVGSDPVPVDVFVHDRTAVFVRSTRGRLHVMVPELPVDPERPDREPAEKLDLERREAEYQPADALPKSRAAPAPTAEATPAFDTREKAAAVPSMSFSGAQISNMATSLGLGSDRLKDFTKDVDTKLTYELYTFDLDPGTYTPSDLPLPRPDAWVNTPIEVIGGKTVSHVLKKRTPKT